MILTLSIRSKFVKSPSDIARPTESSMYGILPWLIG